MNLLLMVQTLVDMSQLQASGSVGLSDGQIDAGAAQVTLDQRKMETTLLILKQLQN